MAPTDDSSTTRMPRSLLVVALALLALRMGVSNLTPGQAQAPASAVAWQGIDSAAGKGTAGNGRAGEGASRRHALTLYEFRADWSGPCRQMEQAVLDSKQIAGLIEREFVPIRVTDRQKEDGKNPRNIADLEKRFHVFAFPTLVVTNPDGEVVSTLVGNASALSTFQFLTRAVHANH